jgi:rare lipoprotein A
MTKQNSSNLEAIGYISRHGFFGLTLLTTLLLFGCASEPVSEPLFGAKPFAQADDTNRKSFNKPYKVRGKKYYPMKSAANYSEQGIASWYGNESGNRTAIGTRFRPHGLSAAHKTLPLPSRVRVTNLSNGRSIEVIVNDRGPFRNDRLIDLSQGAAKKIGLKGLTKVKVESIESLADNSESNSQLD